ncbi:hypothetical protein ABT030_14215 [Streptomyces mirabilis]|uniref:hypothetical protein n=1 Tax=Streptomyces mirabilis TaxID=68239 RepID=UPI00332BE07A
MPRPEKIRQLRTPQEEFGRIPGRAGVVLETGPSMLGLMPAPATGRLVTGLLTGKPDDSLPPGFASGRAISSSPAEPSGGD